MNKDIQIKPYQPLAWTGTVVLIVAATMPPKAIGKALFVTETAEQTQEHVILLVRLAATHMDELFAPEIIEQAHALTER